jgi:hypothetical protein
MKAQQSLVNILRENEISQNIKCCLERLTEDSSLNTLKAI